MIHLLLQTKKFIPNEYHKSFFDIDFSKLYKQGYRLILTDLDNTLISYAEDLANDVIKNKFIELKQIGFEIKLVSNNVPARINKFVKDLDVLGFANARKPLSFGLNKAWKSSETKITKDKTIIIGDQLMTDIYGANRFKAYSILVDPIKKKTEKWYTKINRSIERKMLVKISKKKPIIYKQLGLEKRG